MNPRQHSLHKVPNRLIDNDIKWCCCCCCYVDRSIDGCECIEDRWSPQAPSYPINWSTMMLNDVLLLPSLLIDCGWWVQIQRTSKQPHLQAKPYDPVSIRWQRSIDLEWLKEEKRRVSEESGTGPTGPHKCTCNPSEMKPLLLTSLHLSFSNHINPNTILGNAVSL